MKSKNKRILKITLVSTGVIVIGFVAFYAFLFWSIFSIDFDATAFESSIWKNSPSVMSWESTRLRMVDDFLKQHDLMNQPKERAISLLGDPDKTGYFNDYELVYHLGLERSGMAIDSEWLVINVNTSNTIDEVRLVRD
ncbi:MAG: hypothetical protein D3923_09800 [Candidatus Electrothrix sp. AR3]|nr:hypothetical protein [Candidatus Electrothrix sp. AR3]